MIDVSPMKRASWVGAAAASFLALLPACRSSTAPVASASPPVPPATYAGTPSVPGSRAAASAAPGNEVSDLARREIVRRQEMIRRMDAAALEANRALAENDLEGAVGGFRQASSGLP